MKFLFLLIFFLLGITASDAATGCINTSSILFQTDGTLYMDYDSGTGRYDVYGSKDTNPHANYCVIAIGSCTLQGIGTYTGQLLVSYNTPAGCPMDDHVFLLFFFNWWYWFFLH